MRRVFALALVLIFSLQSAVAGVDSHQAKVSGGSTHLPPVDAQGFLDAKDDAHVTFRYRAGKNGEIGKFPEGTFEVPYTKVSGIFYGDAKHLRVGQTIALTALAGVGGLLLLLSKSHTHYLSIEYSDDKDQPEVISFEVGKDAIQPFIDSLQVRTGKKAVYEAPIEGAPKTTP